MEYNELIKSPNIKCLDGLPKEAKLFIIMCYHKDSEIVNKYKDKLEDRWGAAKQKTGFSGLPGELYVEISEFLIYQNNILWQQYCSCQTLFFEQQKLIMKPLNDSNDDDTNLKAVTLKAKCVNECDSLIEKLDSYLNKIFDKDKNLISHVKAKPIRPENVSELLSVD